jgi:hypothetical protein
MCAAKEEERQQPSRKPSHRDPQLPPTGLQRRRAAASSRTGELHPRSRGRQLPLKEEGRKKSRPLSSTTPPAAEGELSCQEPTTTGERKRGGARRGLQRCRAAAPSRAGELYTRSRGCRLPLKDERRKKSRLPSSTTPPAAEGALSC